MRALWAALFLMRRLRSELGVAVLLVAMVAATALLFAGGPRLFNFVADAGLQHAFRQASTVQRHLQVSAVTTQEPLGDRALEALRQRIGVYLREFPDRVAGMVAEQSLLVTTARTEVLNPPRFTTFISLRYQEPIEGLISLVEGRMPEDTGDDLPYSAFSFFGEPGPAPPPPGEPAAMEIALSNAAADAIGVEVDDELAIRMDPADPLLRFLLDDNFEARLVVVGIFAITDPDDEHWYNDRSLQLPALGGNIESPIYYATALIAPGAYQRLLPSGLPLRETARFFIDPQRSDAGAVPEIVHDLRLLETRFVTSAGGASVNGPPVLRMGLLAIIERYLSQRGAAEAVLTVAAVGPFVLAAGTIGMLAILLITRRRSSLALSRGRGASGPLLIGTQVLEAVLVTGPAAVIGYLAAVALVPGRASGLSPMLALAVAVAATTVLLLASWPAVRRPLDRVGRDDPPVLRTSARRLVLEATAVGLAVAGIGLLRQRGLAVEGPSGELVGADPFLAAVPLLAGLAVGIVAMRLYPLPIRGLGWLAARRADLVAVLGLRSVGRHPAAANLPLLVLMLTAAFGAFSSVIMASIDRGQVEASWEQVGADFRIDPVAGGTLTSTLDPAGVPGIEASAPGLLDPVAPFSNAPNRESAVLLEAIDPVAYEAVVAGSPISPDWPVAFTAPYEEAGLGTPSAPIPAILSQRLPTASQPMAIGDVFEVTVGGQVMTFTVVERRSDFPGLQATGPFVIAPFDQLRVAYQRPIPLRPSVHFARGNAGALQALGAMLRERSPDALVTSRHVILGGLQQAPLVAAVADGFRIALVVAAAYTALAVVAALTLTAARRRQDLAFLRTLGLSGAQSVALTVVEHGPPVLLALAPGIGLGVLLASLLGNSLGLGAFIGEGAVVRIQVDWVGIATVSGALLLVVGLAIGLSTWFARRASAADALRIGDD